MPIQPKWLVFIVSSVILIFIAIFYLSNEKEEGIVIESFASEDALEENRSSEVEQEEISTKLVVDVKGEVREPGVYEMEEGDRVKDVIATAGGLSEGADSYSVNLAQKLYDEMVVIVPNKENSVLNQAKGHDDRIRINQASLNDLTSLPGIGEQKAQQIIQYREENGPFRQVEDLLEISGIGEKTLDKLRELIIVH
ncbi:competence protein ComE [Halalkalibacillus sediminis]|uniref:Competence protein ComE n=1 Tax=Halalkalibacillus sediminis TaxID=2018042 RepID=A0A2I0QXK6_9BACI|nr:ComEA family DNA-binding protein [Halalkalibacillus sediminis]PKR79054.1 competence protein ComE [Halalkalibacillus sediminis]